MSTVSLHLTFNGDAAEAFAYYARVLGGAITVSMTYGGSPMADHVPPAERGLIMHSCLVLDGFKILGADATSSHPYKGSEGFAISLDYPTAERAREVFAALNEGGETIMPMGPTFWAKAFGVTRDRFGVSWTIGGEQLS